MLYVPRARFLVVEQSTNLTGCFTDPSEQVPEDGIAVTYPDRPSGAKELTANPTFRDVALTLCFTRLPKRMASLVLTEIPGTDIVAHA